MKNDPISTLMHDGARTIRMDERAEDIEAFLIANGLTWAPVLGDNGDVMGVISLTDLARFHGRRPEATHTPAWQLCTYRPITVAPDTPIREVAKLMVERRIHHVAVVEDGGLRGVVSALDFVRAFV